MMNEGSNKKKLYLVVGILLFLVVCCIVAFFVWPKFKSNDNGKISDNQEEIIENEPSKESLVKIIDVNSKSRPYAIMINCHGNSLPQSGLQNAYIVYEIMVEYGITRMMALFKDANFDKVGSIRSARNQYLGYVWENDAIYVHAGGSAEAVLRMKSENVDNFSVDGKYGVRDKTLKRDYEHTLFTKSSLLEKATNDNNIRKTTDTKNLLNYSDEELDLSKYKTEKADNISIKYSNYRTSKYLYDADSKTYLRSMNNTKNTDLVTGEQYKVKNIIVYGVKYSTYTDHGYYGYQRISNVGEGDGYYITDGVALPITWTKKDEKSQTKYTIKETGEELVVNDGNTYIQIYPTSGNLTIN